MHSLFSDVSVSLNENLVSPPTSCPVGPTVSIAFWGKFSPVDFNRDFAACLIFLPCTTSSALFNPVVKASRSRVFASLFNKGMDEIATGFI
jgi:hypothetical protein